MIITRVRQRAWARSILVVLLLLSAGFAEQIPGGTTLPVMLRSTLDARKNKPGDVISGRLMQGVTLPSGRRIPAGASVTGHIVEVTPRTDSSSRARIVLQFDRLRYDGKVVPLAVQVRAIASMMEVHEAQLPTNNFDEYGTSISDWNTLQVGGDIVYRGEGTVFSRYGERVARANDTGYVWGKLQPAARAGCPGRSNSSEESLWIFSTSACGTYGFSDLRIVHAGRGDSIGQIVLESDENLLVRGGSAWLLRVDSLAPRASEVH